MSLDFREILILDKDRNYENAQSFSNRSSLKKKKISRQMYLVIDKADIKRH